MNNQNETPLKLIWAIPGSGETHSEADTAFSKSERFPIVRGAWTGNLSPFTKDHVLPQNASPPEPGITQISYTGVTLWLFIVE